MSAVSRYSREQVAHAFGAVLRAARKQRGVTQEQLAADGDFDRTYPSLLERGLRTPTLSVILRLAAALNVSPRLLVDDTAAQLHFDRPEQLKGENGHVDSI